jgi:hypothetical protein
MYDEPEKGTARKIEVDLARDPKDNNKLKVRKIEAAKGGDTIVWKVGDHRVSIWFPIEGVFDEQTLVFNSNQNGDKPGEIHITIPENDLTDPEKTNPQPYQYAIYCHDADEFVECNSHPIMVIPKP